MNSLKIAMKSRISRRSYVDKPIDQERRTQILNLIEDMNKASGLTASFVGDGSAAFGTLKKSYGMFKNVRSILAMKGKSDSEDLGEKVGYYGEQLILELTALGLGTCWVGGTYDAQNIVKILKGEELICVIVVGIVKEAPSTKEKVIRALAHRKVKPMEQRLAATSQPPKWVLDGMGAVLLAPSALNAQKPMFEYKDGCVNASTVVNRKFDLVDLGIAKKHFELGAGGYFELGNGKAFCKDPK